MFLLLHIAYLIVYCLGYKVSPYSQRSSMASLHLIGSATEENGWNGAQKYLDIQAQGPVFNIVEVH